MKYLKLSILIFGIFNSYICSAQSGWFWQNPLPTENSTQDITSVDGHIFIATDNCGLFKSTDQGISWEQGNCPSYNHYESIHFLNSLTGYACGNYTLVKTTDGGHNWNSISTIYNGFVKASFLNTNTGFTVDYNGTLYLTSNSGQTWATINTEGVRIRDFIAFDMINIVCAGVLNGTARILRTSNGGINWMMYSGIAGSELNSILFADSNTGFAGGYFQSNNLYILKSIDGGFNWVTQSVSFTGRIMKLQSINNNIVYGLTSNGFFLASSNSGMDWSFTQFDQANYSNMSMHFVNSSTGFIGGFMGRIFKTTNAGANWTFITRGPMTNFNDISFIDSLTGYSVGDSTVICKTTNAGETWSFNGLNYRHNINSVCFLNRYIGFLACDSGKFYKTTSGGINWSLINLNINLDLNKVAFIDSTGFVCGKNGFLFRTTNDGINWNTISGFTNQSINNICATEQNTYFLAAGNSIYKSIDRGLNWQINASNFQANITSITFVNKDTGTAAGPYCIGFPARCGTKIYTTTNGGLIWSEVYDGLGCCESSNLRFFSNGYGIMIVNTSYCVTTNSGLNWSLKSIIPTYRRVIGSYILNSQVSYVVGERGIIMKTTDSGGSYVVSTENTNSFVPQKISLSQNYPNPFNPQTKIKFDVPSNPKGQTSIVKLVIYDLLGREVTTLVNEELKPGTYEADWDGSNFSSGVYFYKIISGDFVETKKMVLMK